MKTKIFITLSGYFLIILILINTIALVLNSVFNTNIDILIEVYSCFMGSSYFSTFNPFIFGGLAGLILLFYKNWFHKIVGIIGIILSIVMLSIAFRAF